MKYSLETDDLHEFRDALNGSKHKLVIEDLRNYLRSQLKYQQLKPLEAKTLETVREKLNEIYNEHFDD